MGGCNDQGEKLEKGRDSGVLFIHRVHLYLRERVLRLSCRLELRGQKGRAGV
jgi:hypothetical protein